MIQFRKAQAVVKKTIRQKGHIGEGFVTQLGA